MNVQEKILKIEKNKKHNHDLLEFRSWLTEFMPNHVYLRKVQVAGTNGKGSTCQWMNRLMMNSGFNVGMFTSPHLLSHLERIQVNGKNISYEDWERIYDQYEAFFEEKQLTMFEVDLWMAIAYFLEKNVDLAIIEVGLGGREDATTALDYLATVITNIGMDHTELLGDSIEQITYEKSCIFKPGVYALTTERKENSQRVMEQIAGFIQTPLGFVELPYEIEDGKAKFEWMDNTYYLNPPFYQIDNLALALETLSCIGVFLEKEAVQKSIDEFSWNGRFTQISESPKIIIDGAHNPHGMEALIQSIPEWNGNIYFSALKEKDVETMLAMLKVYNRPIILVSFETERLYDLSKLNYPIISLDELMKKIESKEEDMLICGSLYFVGAVLEKVNG